MNKPPWSEAPLGANWLVMNTDGQWFWSANKPTWDYDVGWLTDGGMSKYAGEQYDMRYAGAHRIARSSIYLRPGRLSELLKQC